MAIKSTRKGKLFMKFTEILKSLCNERGISERKMLIDCSINKNQMYNWENKGRAIGNDHAEKLADYFGVTTDYLLGRTETKTATGQSLSDEEQELVTDLVALPRDDFAKVVEYVALLRLKQNP
jgi:transcriptional regulator with XRE-family HTH domain